MDEEKKIFGKVIKRIRVSQGLTQEELGKRCGIHRGYISDTECGSRNVSFITMIKLSEGLNVSLSEIFSEYEKLMVLKSKN